ncbi:DUF99 family protein [Thioalkalivibrio sp. AKL12]|uniref:endonuclease dU n=1 Tax=Thioalkalivibrio sp. AKL12 TaxID=1158159 RepID=UPI00036F7104|nr:DUF99 family protein [Thioalkalivibrio sp. AKL12]
MQERLSHVVGFDDAPFARPHRGDVLVVGAVFAGMRLDSPFAPQLHAILLQGITLAGFNVVDLPALHARTGLPILAVARHAPDLPAIRRALLGPVPGGVRKWRLIEAAGVMEPLAGLYVQRCGLSPEAAQRLLEDQRVHSRLPEPLRVAHMIAGGVTTGASRHRP